MGERVFVTGATGQIGRVLVDRLRQGGDEVVALVRPDPARAGLPSGVELIEGDLHDIPALERGIAGCTRVFHLAGGLRGAGGVSADTLNHVGTRNLTEVATRHKKALRSVVFSSSCAVYGDRGGAWVDEDQAPSPHTAYGHSKVAAEATLLRAAREQGLAVRVARIAAVIGPGLRWMMAEPLRAGRALLPGDGQNLVPLIHIDDAVSAIVALAERGESARIYNVAARTEPNLQAFYQEVSRGLGSGPMRFFGGSAMPLIRLAARVNELAQGRLGRKPRFTPDNVGLTTASTRMRTSRLAEEIGFQWAWPDSLAATAACFSGGGG